MTSIQFNNTFDAIADNPEQARELQIRADLISAIRDRVQDSPWTLAKAAEKVGLNQSEMSNLLNGKVDQFPIELLMKYFRLLNCG